MQGTRAGQVAAAIAASTSPGPDAEISQGANLVSPVKLLSDHQWRTLFPYLHPTDRAEVLGQGSSQDFLSVKSYECDLPTGADQAVLTPIYTPQQFDDYGIPIEGSTVPSLGQTDVQNLDISPGNSATLGVIGKGGRRLPFVNQIVPGRGIYTTPYGFYPYKKPPAGTKFVTDPPQGKNALGEIWQDPKKNDRVVNRPLIDVYLSDHGLTYDKEDDDGFTPIMVKAGRGLSFSSPDASDGNRRFLQVDANDTGLQLGAGAAIIIDIPVPPAVTSVTPQAAGGAGAVDLGEHRYACAWVTADKRSNLSPSVIVLTLAGFEENVVHFDSLNVPSGAISLELYRTKSTGIDAAFYLLNTFPTPLTTLGPIDYLDNTADAALGSAFPGGDPSLISVELATDVDGNNISGLIETGGDDGNGLAVDPFGTSAFSAGRGIMIVPPDAPDPAPTVTVQAGSGLSIGSYQWAITYQYDIQDVRYESNPSFLTTKATSAGNRQALIEHKDPRGTGADVVPPTILGATFFGWGIYRTGVGGSGGLRLVSILSGAGTLSYTDSTPDGSLGAAASVGPRKISTDLAYVGGNNMSGMIDNAGDDGNGLQVNVDGTTITINGSNQLVASGGGGGGGMTVVAMQASDYNDNFRGYSGTLPNFIPSGSTQLWGCQCAVFNALADVAAPPLTHANITIEFILRDSSSIIFPLMTYAGGFTLGGDEFGDVATPEPFALMFNPGVDLSEFDLSSGMTLDIAILNSSNHLHDFSIKFRVFYV